MSIKFTQRRAQWQNENVTNASDKPAFTQRIATFLKTKFQLFQCVLLFSFAPHQRYWITKYHTTAFFHHNRDIQHYHQLQQTHQTNSQAKSGPFCNEWIDQTHDKIPTIVESIDFIKSFTMLDGIQYESIAVDGIHQKKRSEPWSKVEWLIYMNTLRFSDPRYLSHL